ncbi:MAG: peptidoglycan DD-metalloendopeptidase family protein [Candidatus Cloacimonetes bacterium]|nr:peptidoglycan DD-metalloendopeptidase family protein [Candidatus Cloacimonadota bacterium]
MRSLRLLPLLLLLLGCAAVPRDDAEPLRAGLRAYDAGRWDEAETLLAPFATLDTTRAAFVMPLAHMRYIRGEEAEALALMEKLRHPVAVNVAAALAAELQRSGLEHERLSFLQFVEHVAMRYEMDTGLLLAFMKQESSFRAEAVSWAGAVGLMQLMPGTARALGLRVPVENDCKSPPLRDAALDERFHPAKNIESAANHLRFLLNHYRLDSKHTDLTRAIAAYLSGTGNVRDSIPAYARDYVNKVSANYASYRYNQDNQASAETQFYRLNPDVGVFTVNAKATRSVPSAELASEALRMAAMPAHRQSAAALLCNAALVLEAAADTARIDEFYARADSLAAGARHSDAVRFNHALFALERGHEAQATALLSGLAEPELRLRAWLLLAEYAMRDARWMLADSLLRQAETARLDEPEVRSMRALLNVLAGDAEQGRADLHGLWLECEDQAIASYLLAAEWAAFSGDTLVLAPLHRSSLLGHTRFCWPVSSRPVSSRFGWRPHPSHSNWMARLRELDFHSGIDLPGEIGEEVRAAGNGVVSVSERRGGAGEAIYIQHEDGYCTAYYHLDERFVQAGEQVEAGQVIGRMGNTGHSTGPHLHFGVYDQTMRPRNPLLYLP